MIDLSIVVVSWNTRELVIECLRSVCSELDELRGVLAAEVVLVDNGSRDGTALAVAARFPGVHLIALPSNLGYAAGCNVGLRALRGRHVLLLNSDALLAPGTLEHCVRFLDAHPDVGVVGPQLTNLDGSKQTSFHNHPRLATELVPKPLLQLLFRRRFPSRRFAGSEPIDVEAVTGAALFSPAKVLCEVGLLAEEYFFFFEETDFCLRVRRAGWRVVHLPGAAVFHRSGASSKRKHRAATRIEYHRSLYRFHRKFHGRAAMALAIALRTLRSAACVLAQLPLAARGGQRLGRWRSHRDVLLWHLRGRPQDAGLRSLARDGGSA